MRRHPWVLLLTISLPVLGACAGPTTIEPETAESLQQQVRSLATLTQDGETDRALEQAAALEADVQAAAASGAVAPGRAARIQASIDSFVESIQPEEPAPAQADQQGPAGDEAGAEPAQTVEVDQPIAPPKQTTADDRADAAEDAAKEAEKRAKDEAKEREKQEKEDRDD